VFVSGHPGTTNRELTQAQVKRMRDISLPYGLERLNRKEVLLSAWSARDKEDKRRALGALVGTQNGRKARAASLAGLLDPEFMRIRGEAEEKFRDTLRADPSLAEAEAAFGIIEKEINRDDATRLRASLLVKGEAFDSGLFGIARTLVQAGDELFEARQRASSRVSTRPGGKRWSWGCFRMIRFTKTSKSCGWRIRWRFFVTN